MKYYAWIIRAEATQLFASTSGVANNYFLPYPMLLPAENLSGATIFIILRGNQGDVVFKKIYVRKVEKQLRDDTEEIEGLLLTTNLFRSIRVASNYNKGVERVISSILSVKGIGICEIAQIEAEQIMGAIITHIPSRLVTPPKNIFAKVNYNFGVNLNPINFAAQALREVVKGFSLDTIWAGTKYVNPYVNFAIALSKTFNRHDEAEIISQIVALAKDFFIIEKIDHINNQLVVDIDFTPIDITRIKTRQFVASEDTWDATEAMLKTENAEKRHQEILRDTCSFLMKNGYQPEQTTSVDLAIKIKEQYTPVLTN